MTITTVKVALSTDFLKAFADIPRAQQNAVMKFVAQFKSDPTASGIHYEKIQRAADLNMRSVRIDQNYRGIVLKPERGDVYCLLWVARHDDAYDWAARHKVAVHPDLGSLQIYPTELVEPPSTPPATEGPFLFKGLKDRELLKLGVPAEALPSVQRVRDEHELDLLQGKLPDEAYEALFLYAAGESYESLIASLDRKLQPVEVDTADFALALDNEDSQRRFYVITDDEKLNELLSAPLERWRVFLHPSQRKLVERDWAGPVRVLGGAGTGKTVVAMHRARYLAERAHSDKPKPVLFVTFSATLAQDIRQNLSKICSPPIMERIEVSHLDRWVSGFLRSQGYAFQVLFDNQRRTEFWQQALTCRPDGLDFPDAFYRAEFERVVLPTGCSTVEEYMRASRVGRGGQLNRAQRKLIWPVFAEYRIQLKQHNLREPDEAYRDALALIDQKPHGPVFLHIIVDEAQDLSASAFSLIRALAPQQENDLFIVGDAHQRIYRNKVVLSKVNINVRGRGRRLRVNYRTTDEIRRWAVAQLESCRIDDLDGESDSLKGYQSLTHGPAPEILESMNRVEEFPKLLDCIRRLEDAGVVEQDICLVARDKADVNEYNHRLRMAGFETLKLTRSENDDRNQKGIRLSTMHRVKGLEFDAVLIAGFLGIDFYTKRFSADEDAGIVHDAGLNERCLLHVAATRGKRFLVVSYVKQA